MSKPHIVLVPGAWHSPDAFGAVNTQLEAHGFTIHARQLPAVGNKNPPPDLSEDIAVVQALVDEAIGPDGNDVIVIPHSWGGIITGSALVGYGKKEREKAGKKGGVVTVAYIAAFILPEGVCLLDAIPGIPEWWDIKEPHAYANDPQIFYNDLSPADSAHWFSQLQSQNMSAFRSPATAASWKTIPTAYLVCELDQAIPLQAQLAMTDAVRDAGAEIVVSRIEAGHSPFLSKVEETAKWIRGVAGEKV
ncbi:alpha/beta-hydrolase [Pyrenochaeta sp. DS3sAY3a]|nr:alpha/beta-hydrolase [Pyrenochaeta sp. DS3sAY3a]